MNNLVYILAILLPTIIVAIDKSFAPVSIASVVIGLIVIALLGLKSQLTKHKDGIFAHLTSPGEFLNLKLTNSEKKVLWLGLAITLGGLLALAYLILLSN